MTLRRCITSISHPLRLNILTGAKNTSCPNAGARYASTASFALERILGKEMAGKSHQELHRYSIEKPSEFWGAVARSELTWAQDFDQVTQCDMQTADFKWFINGKLNAAVNCVDRHAESDPGRVALLWERDEPGNHVSVTYAELAENVGKLANALKRRGVRKGDVVAIYMPASPDAVAAMLACARIGAVHTVIFAGFSAEAIATRIQDSKSVAVIVTDETLRGGKVIDLKTTVDVALKSCPTVKTVLVDQRVEKKVSLGEKEQLLKEAMDAENGECPPELVDSEDLLFLLYTSGSTGHPKGVAHSTGGYLTYAGLTHKSVFDYRPGDVFGCVADIGWITGHSYVVYGPLVNGATTVLFESTPLYPDPGRYWETVQRLRINHFYGAPTAIRLLMKYEDEFVTKYDRSSLKTLGSVGEPMNLEAWKWYHGLVGEGRCDLVDTWWQTETGGICIAPRPSEEGAEIVGGKAMRPMFGIQPAIIDEKGKELEGNDIKGALCLKYPWPGMARTIIGDHKRFIDTYFSMYPGYYFTGDGGHKDKDGYWQITGRMDDVINVTGHRLGTAEVECALNTHELVAESAVVGYPHDIKGEGVYAYVILKDGVELHGEAESKMMQEMKKVVKSKISGFAVPEYIQFCHGLPKTRSGKIMRRILRKVAASSYDDLGDISTLAEPHVVQEIIDHHKSLLEGEK